MKYISHLLLSLIFILIFGSFSNSQVIFGARSGINIATTKDRIAFPKNRIGWYVGGAAIIPLHNKFFLQPELIYSSKGDRSANPVGPSNSVMKFNYLNLPILIGYRIDMKTFLLIGPELGYLTDAKLKVPNGVNFIDVTESHSPRVDAGIDIGISYKMKKEFAIEARYNYGFKLMYYIDGAGVVHDETKSANRVFQIGLKYFLKNKN